jgi:hypothetical protein
MIRHEHVTGNVLGYLGMGATLRNHSLLRKRCHP